MLDRGSPVSGIAAGKEFQIRDVPARATAKVEQRRIVLVDDRNSLPVRNLTPDDLRDLFGVPLPRRVDHGELLDAAREARPREQGMETREQGTGVPVVPVLVAP